MTGLRPDEAADRWRNAPPPDAAVHDIASTWPLADLTATAARLRDHGHGPLVSYSRKVFVPLTRLCRDVCAYCTFAHTPRKGEPAYLSPDERRQSGRACLEASRRDAGAT